MNAINFKTFSATLLASLVTQFAHAAHFEYVGAMGSGTYFANATGVSSLSQSGNAKNLSGTDYALFDGAGNYSSSLGFGGGSLQHGFASTGFLGLSSGGGAQLNTSLSVAADVQATGGAVLNSLNLGANLALTPVTLKLVGDREANGTAVNVIFSGLAEYFNTVAQGLLGGITMDMAVIRGNDVLGEFLWDTSDASFGSSRAVKLSFSANIGDELGIGAFIDSLHATSSSFSVTPGSHPLVNAGGSLNGAFTISPVPEPQIYALVLLGLGVLGFAARRRI